ncbi:MAG: GDSL-type esterase/lipase family protein [Oscillospiraceae bacterium]
MKLDDKIQEKLNERKWYHRVTAITVVFSLLCAFFVPLDLALPGVALTNESLNNGVPYIENAPLTSIPAGAADLTSKIDSITFTVGGQTYTGTKNSEVTVQGGSADPLGLSIAMIYEFSDKASLSDVLSSGFSYYQMTSDIKPNNGYYGSTMIVIDADWNPTKAAGYYSISEGGLIVIHYTDDYLTYLSNSKGMRGTLNFQGTAARGQNEGGDKTFTFGTTEVLLQFDDTKPTITKDGTAQFDGTNRYVDWQITIRNPNGYVDMSKYTLTDTMNGDALDWSTINPTITPEGVTASLNSDGTITFTNPVNPPEYITITYRQNGATIGSEYDNQVSLTKGDVTIPASKKVEIENGLNISKTGTPDYELAEGIGGKVQWTIEVSHKSGDSLHNAVIKEQGAVFNTGFADLTVTDKVTGAVIGNDKYTISEDGTTLTFKEDTSIPASVIITFMAQEDEYDNSTGAQQSQTLSNYVKASRSDIVNEASTTGTVEYKHELSFSKTLNGPNQELGTLEWQFTLKSNEWDGSGDANSKESINGYTITDPIFVGMSEEDINQKIGFNIYNYVGKFQDKKGDQNSTGEQKVTLQKSSTDSDTITISFNKDAYPDIINMIKLYYVMNIEDNLSEEDWAKYNKGETVNVSNTATAKDRNGHQSQNGTDGKDINLRVEASKSYGGANNSEDYSFGNEDTANRVLYWDVDLTKDAGFKSTDTYEDQLVTNNTNVGHYITSEQRSAFTLIGSSSVGDTKQTVPASLYTITFVDADGDDVEPSENAAGFVITFTSAMDALETPYRYLKLHYASTAKTSDVPAGSSVTFSNNYDFGNQHKTAHGMTYTRDNPADVKPLTIKVNKTWNDSQNAFGDRPSTITVKVLRAEADENGNLPASPEWETLKTYTLAASATNGSDSYTLADDFDQWKYDETTGTVTQYYYKIEEVLDEDSGYTLTYIDNPKKIEISKSDRVTENMALINKSDHSIAKYAIDADGNHVTSVNAEAKKLTINGKEGLYYLFRWEIMNIPGNSNDIVEFVDTIPTGSIFVDDTIADDTYKPIAYTNQWNIYELTERQNAYSWGYKKNSATLVSFYKTESSEARFRYYTAVPVDQIDSVLVDGKISNSVTYDGNTTSVSIDVSTSLPEDDTDHLTKEFQKGFAGGYLNYTIDVNPTGKKLSNNGTIDITDILSYTSGKTNQYGSDIPLEDLNITLNSISVYPLVNGEADTSHPLDGSEYSYTIDYNTRDSENLSFSDANDGDYYGSVKYYIVNGWKKGQQVTITVPKNPSYSGGETKLNAIIYNGEIDSSNLTKNLKDAKPFPAFDDEGNTTLTFVVPDDAENIVITSGFVSQKSSDTLTGYNVADDGVSATANGTAINIVSKGEHIIPNNGRFKFWEITGWNVGDSLLVTQLENPEFTAATSSGVGNVVYLAYGTDGYDLDNIWWPTAEIETWENDLIGSKTWSDEIASGIKHIFVASKYIENKEYNVDVYSTSGGMTGVSQGTITPAVLDITVPDQQPLRIEYHYLVEGWEAGNILKFANTASFYADNGEGSWSTSDDEMSTNSSATAETLRYPTIYKTDIGNYAINDLNASFLVAKYVVGSGWVYANEITTTEGTQTTFRTLKFPDSPYTGCLETVGAEIYPTYAGTGTNKPAILKLGKSNQGNHEDVHNFDLEAGQLYKFVEITSPAEYRQPNWLKGYAENQEFVFYYNYNGFEGTPPAEAEGKVKQILNNGAVNIPNSQNISVTATKSFSGKTEDLPESSTVQLSLYWSTSKKGANQKLVSSEDLDLPSGFSATQTVNYTKDGKNNTVTWTEMPSGLNGGPIYYFVREISYTYEGVTYTYDEDSQKYLNGTTEGKFQPVYTRNGTNTDGTNIEVNNSEGIMVKKLWVNLKGDPVTPPNEVGSTNEKMKVGFIVYGVKKSDGSKVRLLLDKETLTEADNYEYVLPPRDIECSDGSTCSLADFSTFEIAENLTDEQMLSLYGRFLSPQTTRKISNGTGTLEIINTDVSSPTTNAIVQKIWKDGNLDHGSDTLTVELLQSTNANLTSAQLESYVKGTAIAGVYSQNSMRSIDNVKLIENGGSRTTIEFDSNIAGVTGSTDAIVASWNGMVLTVIGNAVDSTNLKVTLENGQTKEITVTSIDYEVTLNAQNEWTYTWENLPYSDGEHNYYYYVIEKSVPDDYSVSYHKSTTSAGQTTQITNSLPTQLKIQKEWYADGQQISTSDATASALPDTILVNVYQKLKTETVGGTATSAENKKNYTIMAMGDSITDGYISQDNGYRKYFYNQMVNNYGYTIDMLGSQYAGSNVTYTKGDGTTITYDPNHEGHSGWSIQSYGGRTGLYTVVDTVTTYNPEIILLMIGTNDVLDNHDMDNVETRLKTLVDKIYELSEAKGTDVKLFLITPTRVNSSAVDWLPIQAVEDAALDKLMTAMKNIATSEKATDSSITTGQKRYCEVIDVYQQIYSGEDYTKYLNDYVHPNEDGYELMGNYIAAQLNSYLSGVQPTIITNPTNISMPGASADIDTQFSGTLYGTYTLEKSKGYKLSLDELPEKNSLGVEYVYYIKENGTHVLSNDETYYTLSGNENQYIESVTYLNNGQLAADSGTVTIRNTIKTAELSIKKIWDDELPHTGDTITVRIHRETVADSDDAQQNPLTLAMSVENGSTIQIPIGNTDGIEITSNKGVNPTVVGSGIATPTTETTSKKVWKIRPADDAKVGDTATVTFTDGSGQKVTVSVEIVNNPQLTLEASETRFTANANNPTLSPVWTIQYTPSGGTPQSLDATDANVTFTSSNPSAATIDDDGVLTVVNGGTTTITATYNDNGTVTSATFEVTIDLPSFSADDITVTAGGDTAQITVSPSYGTFTYESADESVATVDSSGNVTGVEAGSTTITITRRDGNNNIAGEPVTIDVTVKSSSAANTLAISNFESGKWYDISNYFYANATNGTKIPKQITVTFEEDNGNAQMVLNGDFVRTDWTGNGDFQYTGVSGKSITVDVEKWNTYTKMEDCKVKFNQYGSTPVVSLTFIYDTAKSGTQSVAQSRKLLSRFNSNTLRLGAALNYTALPLGVESETESESTSATAEFNDSGIWEFTLTSSNSWQKQLNGLPVYKVNTDGTLQSYYYWAEEIEINGMPVAGYTVSYSFTDGDSTTDYSINAANLGANPLITIKNTLTDNPSEVDLPTSGGSGTAPYRTAGFLLMMTAVTFPYIKHRNRRKRNSA